MAPSRSTRVLALATLLVVAAACGASKAGSGSSPPGSSAPPDLPGAPGTPVATAGDGAVALTWSAPAHAGAVPIRTYTVSVEPTVTCTVAVTGTTADVTGLANGVEYTFRVRASTASGDGLSSDPASAIPFGLPGQPTAVAATPADSAATVTWAAAAPNGRTVTYVVTADPGGATSTTTSTTALVAPLVNGTPYTFTVTAANAAGSGAASVPSAAVTPRTVPGAPRSPTAAAGDAHVQLGWDAPLGDGGAPVQGYAVTVTPDGGPSSSRGAAALGLDVTGLANRTAYRFAVAAVNAAGTGPTIEIGPVTPRAPVSAVLSTVLVDPAGAVTADGASQALLTVVVRDAEGYGLGGQSVTIEAGGTGNHLVQLATTTDASGVVAATLASTVAEQKALTVTVNGSLPLTGLPGVTFGPGAPAKLRIAQGPPASVPAGVVLAPALQVRIEDAFGNVTPSTADVDIGVVSGPIGGALLGTVTRAASAGVVTFDDLSLQRAGTYTLTVASARVTSATAAPFDVTAAAPAQLTFEVGPGPIRAGVAFSPTVQVAARDAYGNLASTAAPTIALRLAPTSALGALTGTSTSPASAGIASFWGLSVDQPGTYALTASSGSLPEVTSAPFDVTVAWSAVTPEGGQVTALGAAADGSLVLATAAGQVWRSRDGGLTWERASAGLPIADHYVAVDPTNPQRAFASSWLGVYRTEDGGRRWQPVLGVGGGAVAVSSDGTATIGTHRSTDGGTTWTNAGASTVAYARGIAYSPADPTVAWAATGTGVYRSTDRGLHWTACGSLPSSPFCWSVAANPVNALGVWAATNGGVFVSSDGCATWTLRGTFNGQSTAVAFDPAASGDVYAALTGQVNRSLPAAPYWISTGQGLTQVLAGVPGSNALLAGTLVGAARLAPGGSWQPAIAGLRAGTGPIAVHPTKPSVVLSGAAGVRRSTDGGASWSGTSGASPYVSATAIVFDPSPPYTAYASATGFYRSTDEGATWTALPGAIYPNALLVDRTSGVLLAAIGTGVQRSADGGATWTTSDAGLNPAYVKFFLQDPVDARVIYAGSMDKGLFRSADGGVTWAAARAGLPVNVVSGSIDPRSPSTLLVVTSSGLYGSTDSGASWSAVFGAGGFTNTALARDPANPAVLLAATTQGVQRSEDGGATWFPASTGYPAGSVATYSVVFAPSGDDVFVSGSTGVYRTRTGGK
jgi:hypothetical protein